ncbi:hypothetical protein U1Q18_012046 [Sarracenia purpurea var. burkii]
MAGRCYYLELPRPWSCFCLGWAEWLFVGFLLLEHRDGAVLRILGEEGSSLRIAGSLVKAGRTVVEFAGEGRILHSFALIDARLTKMSYAILILQQRVIDSNTVTVASVWFLYGNWVGSCADVMGVFLLRPGA